MQDAVLRMLVDKYKPLRRGNGSGSAIESADEKLKRDIPRVTARSHSSWEDVDSGLDCAQAGTQTRILIEVGVIVSDLSGLGNSDQ